MTQPSTHLHPRAEVVGYPEPVLEAIRDLVHEVQADTVLAFGSGQMMLAMGDMFAVDRKGRPSDLYGALARLVVVTAETTIEKGSDQ